MKSSSRPIPAVALAVTLGLLAGAPVGACSGAPQTTLNETSQGGAGPSGTGGSGQGGEDFVAAAGSGGSGGACVADALEATLEKRPVDVIVVVDTSASMQPASDAVEANLNANLAAVLGASGLDYRVVVLAGYGDGTELCIGPPLGGAPCAPAPPQPANTATFHHYVSATGSGAFLSNVLAWYNSPDDLGQAPSGWSGWLRPDAHKVFLAFSDTSSSSSDTSEGDAFDAALLALQPAMFGTLAKRDYVFHSIIGLMENAPATAPWLPGDAVVSSTCTGYPGGLAPGQPLQQVSIVSGGWRFPLCQFGSFDVVFQQIAAGVVEKTTLACDFSFPEAPPGKTIDPDTVELEYTPGGGGAKQPFSQVKGAADCKAGSFWVESTTIHLCPETCALVEADTAGAMSVHYGCDVGFAQ